MAPRLLWVVRLAAVAAVTWGCVGDAPTTRVVAWDEAACASTRPGYACVTLHVSVASDVREDADDLVGAVHWALYADGDVGGFGPGDARSLRGDHTAVVDLSARGAACFVHVADVPATALQVLAFLDADGSGDDSSGDPVTLPTDAFSLEPDVRTQVEVVLDYIE